MNDQAIERQIQAKGLTAPRITPADIEENIAGTHYFTAAQGVVGAGAQHVVPPQLGLLTICVLVLRNGFTVTGESACASAENFDADIGRQIARKNAFEKIWPLMGYQLRDHLHRRAMFDAEPKTGDEAAIRVAAPSSEPSTPAQMDGAFVSLTFGDALVALKGGAKVARAGWNGKGLFVYLVPAASYPTRTGAAKSFFGDAGMVPYNAYLALKGADDTVSTWAPSCSDALAEDWLLVGDASAATPEPSDQSGYSMPFYPG